jgi:hypothetical protein
MKIGSLIEIMLLVALTFRGCADIAPYPVSPPSASAGFLLLPLL